MNQQNLRKKNLCHFIVYINFISFFIRTFCSTTCSWHVVTSKIWFWIKMQQQEKWISFHQTRMSTATTSANAIIVMMQMKIAWQNVPKMALFLPEHSVRFLQHQCAAACGTRRVGLRMRIPLTTTSTAITWALVLIKTIAWQIVPTMDFMLEQTVHRLQHPSVAASRARFKIRCGLIANLRFLVGSSYIEFFV